MNNLTQQQIAVLSDVVRALRDANVKPRVATVFGKIGSENNNTIDVNGPHDKMPLKKELSEVRGNGAFTFNEQFAESISLGNGITMRRINLPPVPTKQTDRSGNKVMIDRGAKYIVRTPSGEAEFDDHAYGDFFDLWRVALQKSTGKENYPAWLKNLDNKQLREIAAGPMTPEMNKTERLNAAKEKMTKLGIEQTPNLDMLIAHIMQNQND